MSNMGNEEEKPPRLPIGAVTAEQEAAKEIREVGGDFEGRLKWPSDDL